VSGRAVDSLVAAQMVRIWADQAQSIGLTQMFYFVRGILGEIAVTCDGRSQRIAASQGEERAAYRARPPRTPMTVDERKEWSRQSGRAPQAFGLARRWTNETARAVNAKRTMPGSSRMAKTGRLGGLERLA
jgi:hypothetical protein